MTELALHVRAKAGDFSLDLDLDLHLAPIALVGPNGAGKTTLLRLLAGGLKPESGRVAARGRVLVDVEAGVYLSPEQRGVGYLPQAPTLFPHLSVEDNVAFGAPGASREARRESARGWLGTFGVEALAPRRPRGLSGGEQLRVGLSRALAADPALLLLDEPTAALDVRARREAREALGRVFRDADRCCVVVTHDLRDLLVWRPYIVLLEQGRVAAHGTFDALRDSEHPFLAELMGPLDR